MGTEAEIDGFLPTANRFDVTGLEYASTVFDPLTTFGKDNKVHPYLAQSIDHNADYTTWTIKLRPNIKFSNGDPLTADDVVTDLQAHQKSPLTGPAIANIDTVTKVDDLTVHGDVQDARGCRSRSTWPARSASCSRPRCSPTQGLAAPDRDRAVHLEGVGAGQPLPRHQEPQLLAEGPALPRLDRVPAHRRRPVPGEQPAVRHHRPDALQRPPDPPRPEEARAASTRSTTARWRARRKRTSSCSTPARRRSTTSGSARRWPMPPTARQYNQHHQLRASRRCPTGRSATSARPSTASTGYPGYDLQKAKDLVKAYEQSKGTNSLTFELGTTNAGRNLQAMSLLQDMWQQGRHHRQHQAGRAEPVHPQRPAGPVPGVRLAPVRRARPRRRRGVVVEPDGRARRAAGAELLPEQGPPDRRRPAQGPHQPQRRRPGRRLPGHRQAVRGRPAVLWFTNEAVWQIAYKPNVHGITTWTLPDGTPGIDHTLGGFFLLSHVWVG